VNKANIIRSKTKKKGKNHGIQPSRMESFRWLLRNGMNKTDIDGVKTEILV